MCESAYLYVPATEGRCCVKESYTSCCSYGSCNIFCCNCNDECQRENRCNTINFDNGVIDDVIGIFGRKRSSTSQSNEAEIRFAKLDRNGDGVIR